MTIKIEQRARRRRPAEEVRQDALHCARRLLLDHGPTAITLKAVAEELGMTHGNVTHHFGSANGLQGALAEAMIRDLVEAVQAALTRMRAGETQLGQVVDIVFDAFDRGGAGQLIAWLASSGHRERLVPLYRTVAGLADALDQLPDEGKAAHRPVGPTVAAVLASALGAALLGDELTEALGVRPGLLRAMTTLQIDAVRPDEVATPTS
jgi:AcrR family transcriptional regulator